MRHLDLTDLVALAAEVAEVEMPKVLELLDTAGAPCPWPSSGPAATTGHWPALTTC